MVFDPARKIRFARSRRSLQARSGEFSHMIGGMKARAPHHCLHPSIALLSAAILLCPRASVASVRYATDFKLEKRVYVVGEPIFCYFMIRNTGSETFVFAHRAPTRALNPDLGPEPRFVLRDAQGRRLADPAPHSCGGAKGRAVYGSITLPPGGTSTEGWVLNQWGKIDSPGLYHLHAERHLPLFALQPGANVLSGRPAAYALAVEDLSFRVVPGTARELEKAYQPLVEALRNPRDPRFAEAVVAITSVPHPFLQAQLVALLGNRSAKYPWARQRALEGLARLGTPSAWQAVLNVALGRTKAPDQGAEAANETAALRANAILLLAERGDRNFVPSLLELLRSGPEPIQEDVLPALGFFHDPRANQALFERLHSPKADDRVNSILGLKNLNSKDAVPALLAMLNDPDEGVRRVANFALQSLTRQKFSLPPRASRARLARTVAQWNRWWQDNNVSFTPAPQPACRDW